MGEEITTTETPLACRFKRSRAAGLAWLDQKMEMRDRYSPRKVSITMHISCMSPFHHLPLYHERRMHVWDTTCRSIFLQSSSVNSIFPVARWEFCIHFIYREAVWDPHDAALNLSISLSLSPFFFDESASFFQNSLSWLKRPVPIASAQFTICMT